MSFTSIVSMFYVDMISIIMTSLVSFIGIIVYFFSRRYMKGDALYRQFFLNILILLISVILVSIADNLVLFLSAWCCCNLILARLIVHKSTWKAAKASGRLAIRNFILGFSFIILAFAILYKVTGSLSIQYIVHNANDYWYTLIALVLLLMGAMTQSAIWPFHRWLTSSLNSPTPVSALMHAGIVNGGGFLLARFAPLYFSVPKILNIIFIVGLTGALLGSLWKLMQHDVKRMLACSTMGQMGFMFVQFGLGFFASGLAHLFWHGMFKAYLFLASGSAAQEKRLDFGSPPRLICFLFSLACGAFGSYIFAIINHKNWLPSDTSLIIDGIVFIAGAQLAFTLLRGASIKKLPLAMIVTSVMAALYGANVYFFDLILSPLELMQPQPLTILHVISLILLALSWLFILFFRYSNYKADLPNRLMRSYVKVLNNSQPHPETVTSYRKGYDYAQEKMTERNSAKEELVIDLDSKENNESFNHVDTIIKKSWAKISPFWPLKNLIAVNPMQGLEDLPIEKALLEGAVFFEQKEFPKPMELINRQTIKWLQAFFDEGQATIGMPLRTNGFYKAFKKLAYFDKQIHGGDFKKKQWILGLSKSPETAITECLLKLKIPKESQSIFMTLMLTTLPGWASYIKYRVHWTEGESLHPHPVSEADYMAVRLIITSLLWEEATELIQWHKKAKELQIKKISPIKVIEKNEADYLLPLLSKIGSQKIRQSNIPEAQIIFCIDVRSEPFRRALEGRGHYETFGFAGFFGIPVRIKNTITEELYSSCPVLLKPQNTVNESPYSSQSCVQDHKGYQNLNILKTLYQSLKYNFTTSFVLVEMLGFAAGFWMALRSLTPILAIKYRSAITERIRPNVPITPSLENISFLDQCTFAESALRAIGLTKNFSSLIVFCGHGSATQNNAYATALDCGACGGHHGASNARILAKILNTQKVREHLHQAGIFIPKATHFLAAEHNTTADEVEIYCADKHDIAFENKIQRLQDDLKAAGRINSQQRSKDMGLNADKNKSAKHTKLRSIDWAEVRPEWGLARNASFIVAPREMTKDIDLEGRAFLHSYDYRQDPDGTILTLILTAPMVVAQWINSQYLFSTLDNVAYGSGSKVTTNITGKIGIMQGNASDLMTGLPLQSVYRSDKEAYHENVRLMTIVYAPTSFIDKIIEKQFVLQKLFRNGWVLLICIDPENTNHHYFLDRDLTWRRKS